MILNLNGRELKCLLSILNKDFSVHWKVDIEKLKKKINRALKPIKVSSRKGKGKTLQYKVCEDIAKLTNTEFNQQDDQCDIHSREMGQAGRDIILRNSVYFFFPFCIECKSVENLHIDKAIKQVKKNVTENDKGWLIIHKKKNKEILVTLEWKLFLVVYTNMLLRGIS